MLVFPGLVAVREALARFPTLAEQRFLVAVVAHAATATATAEERAAGWVGGRSLSEQPAT